MMNRRRLLFAFWLFAMIVAWFGRDGVRAEEPSGKSAPLSELQQIKLVNLSLRQTILNQQQQQLNDTRTTLKQEICKEASIEIEACQISPDGKTVFSAPVRPPNRPQHPPREEKKDPVTDPSGKPQGKP